MDGLTPEEKRYWFPDVFFDSLESWFSADIACCDHCHDDFIAKWPHAYEANNAEFQRSLIPLDCFYSGSKLADAYTEDEFNTFIEDIRCQRCGNQVIANIWAYNLPFDVEDDFESNIEELAEIAHSTPFLMLRHEFAIQVLSTIDELSRKLESTIFAKPLCRARKGNGYKNLVDFDAPPRTSVGEGRYNHAGGPVIYLASDEETCTEEMRRHCCTIAELKLEVPLKVLDLNTPGISHPEFEDQLSSLSYSALISVQQSESGWSKPEYVFSRFVADCARSAGIQAIKYPSTRILKEGNYNLVIIDSSISLVNHAKLLKVTELNAVSN